jgi:hypothetical protein
VRAGRTRFSFDLPSAKPLGKVFILPRGHPEISARTSPQESVAAADQNQRDNDDPKTVVTIKQIAQAVHIESSLSSHCEH